MKIYYHELVPQIAQIAIDETKDQEGLLAMMNWLEKTLSLRFQVILGLALSMISVIVLFVVDAIFEDFDLHISLYVSFAAVFFIGGQASYWGFRAPTYIKELSKHDLNLFFFDPSGSAVIKSLSRLVSSMLLAGSLLVLAFAVMTYLFFLRDTTAVALVTILAAWYILGIGSALFIFFYSNHYLSFIIRTERQKSLHDLMQKIQMTYMKRPYFDREQLDIIRESLEIHRVLKKNTIQLIYNIRNSLVNRNTIPSNDPSNCQLSRQ